MPRHWACLRAFAVTIAAVLALASTTSTATAVTRATSASGIALTAGVTAVVTAVAFPDRASGWALGQEGGAARIWHTGTAGATWQVQWRGSGTPLAVSAPDLAHAWVLIGCAGRKPSCGRELLGTSDGGQRWRVLASLAASVD